MSDAQRLDAAPAPAAPAAQAPRPRTLLFVDDEENIVSAMKRLLRRDGYRLLTATSGEEGLRLLQANDVDVIMSDQRMPTMTGVEFLCRAKESHPDTVRIVLSGYTELSSITDAINEGSVYKFLTKPWDDVTLRSQIRDAFEQKALADENRMLTRELEATNRELAAVNTALHTTLARLAERSAREGMCLDVAREALQYVPLPVIGVDIDGVVAFANASAVAVMPHSRPLLGVDAADALPKELVDLLAADERASCTIELGSSRYRAVCRNMGSHSMSRGKLLALLPQFDGKRG